MNAHFLKNHDDHPDFGADIKLHGSGGPFAISNPYSSSKSCFKPCNDYDDVTSYTLPVIQHVATMSCRGT